MEDKGSQRRLKESTRIVLSARFAAQMEEMFELDKTNAREITLEEWERRPLYEKAIERGLAPLRVFG